ncbi:Wadjet anti-phage system protein JetA family protein [Pseudomonas nicosulfuronedens]
MDVRSLASGNGNLFELIPDRLFGPLASANRYGYWSLLCYLHRKRFGPDAPLPPSYGYTQRDIAQDIQAHIEFSPIWQPEEGETPDTPLSMRAANCFHRLVNAGWFRSEKFGLTPTVSMQPAVNQLLTQLISFADTGPVFVSGKIRSIDAAISQVLSGEAGGDSLQEAAEQCRNLLVHIRNTGISVRDFMTSISAEGTTAEYVRKFFLHYVEQVFIGDYKELRTQEHPLSKRPQILAAVEQISEQREHRQRLLEWYVGRLANGDKARGEAAFERDLSRLNELSRIEEYLERLDDEIRCANKRALVVIQYRLRSTRPIDGLLRQAIDGLIATGLVGDFDGDSGERPRLFAPDMLMAGNRLAQPRKETHRLPPSPLRQAVISEHTRAIGNLVKRAQERRRITPAKLRAYAQLALGDKAQLDGSELPVEGIEQIRAYQAFVSLAASLNSGIPSLALRARTQIPGLDVFYEEEQEAQDHPYLISKAFRLSRRKPLNRASDEEKS